jgi:hypothetical protein
MLLFGHRFIASERFYHIEDIDRIFHTPSNALLYVEFSEEMLDVLEHMRSNRLKYAVKIESIEALVYAEALDAAYIVVSSELAKDAQRIAEHYLFDAKILVQIEEESEIEVMAYEGIDGVIFPNAVIRVNA